MSNAKRRYRRRRRDRRRFERMKAYCLHWAKALADAEVTWAALNRV